MIRTLSAVAARRTPLVATPTVHAVVLVLLLAGHAALAAVIAASGMAVLAVLLALSVGRTVRAEQHVDELAADLAAAYTDPVTGIPVRAVAEQHLLDAAGTAVTVALIDVDGMHDINTVYTHDGGDLYLAELSDRLRRAAEPGDMVARLGGDEFVVVTARCPHAVASSLAAAMEPPVTIDGVTRPMRVSVGICRTPGGDPHVALGRADRAMYTAKRRGSGIEHYDPDRDGEPLSPGVRPAVRHRDRRAARHTADNS